MSCCCPRSFIALSFPGTGRQLADLEPVVTTTSYRQRRRVCCCVRDVIFAEEEDRSGTAQCLETGTSALVRVAFDRRRFQLRRMGETVVEK
ncbi:hypothetical protein C0Q70_17021 [Pomacea canaliculata]|uniref:Uncharacterized protein n=1 Tax=Pomacea canaliculata TaxID=400727 RepID=A0A2T7NRH1_POMCA|nr:hypothetical protein C0Q70_17021 [Pomacea canaliculata]